MCYNGKSETGEFLYRHENSQPNCDDLLQKKKLFILIKLWINATLINVLQVEQIEIYLEIKSEC